MGDNFSSSTRWEVITMLLPTIILATSTLVSAQLLGSGIVSSSGLGGSSIGSVGRIGARGIGGAGGRGGGGGRTVIESQVTTQCNTVSEEVCHEVHDTVIETTYVEECQDVVTQECHQTSQQVHYSAGEVGKDTRVLSGGSIGVGAGAGVGGSAGTRTGVIGARIGKREADPALQHLRSSDVQSSPPRCKARTERQCQQRPVEHAVQVPRTECTQVPREICTPVEIPVSRTVCDGSQSNSGSGGFSG